MKKSFKVATAFLLCLSMVFTLVALPALAKEPQAVTDSYTLEQFIDNREDELTLEQQSSLIKIHNKVINVLLNNVIFKLIGKFFPNCTNVLDYDSFKLDEMDNFYEGTDTFLDEPADAACWNLGYAQQSILPSDFGEKLYVRGSYVPYWMSSEMYVDDEGKAEDMKVRTVILNDGTGRGSAVFAVLDCIGISNYDVRLIRESLADFAAKNNIVSINVSATHTHSGIDTQGVWTDPIGTMARNYFASKIKFIDMKFGVDEEFLNTIINQTKLSVEQAYADLKPGELTYTVKDVASYIRDRTAPIAADQNLYRLWFTPDDAAAKATVIATFGCHPETVSYDFLRKDDGLKIDTKISADFIYYMEKLVNKEGHNFLYIQGNVGTMNTVRGKSCDALPNLTSHDEALRYGYEMAYITLGLSLSKEQCIELNTRTGDLLGVAEGVPANGYTVWYDGWTAVEAQSVEPVLNVRHSQYISEMESTVAQLLTKTGLASNTVIYDKGTGKYFSVLEIGYVEFGDSVKMFLCPGELYSELLVGGKCLEGFDYPCLRDTHGDNLIVCDLMNDAAGYISPDNYYVLYGLQYNEATAKFEGDSWCLLVSMGKNTASTIIREFNAMVESIKRS